MDLKYTTRRGFWFECDSEIEFEKPGVVAEKGIMRFSKTFIEEGGDRPFKTEEDCRSWLKINEESTMKTQRKNLGPITCKAVDDVTAGDWEKMKRFIRKPDKYSPDDFVVYRDYLAHNVKDRDGQRFPIDMLKNFDRTIPGKPKMLAHERGHAGKGRYFDSEIIKMSVDEFTKFIGEHPDPDIAEHLKMIEERDGGLYWLVPSWYIRAKEVDLIDDIDSGIAGDGSIGFGAQNITEVKDEETDATLWWEFQGKGEAREGSLVWLGSQYGARTKEPGDDDSDDDKTVPNADDDKAGKSADKTKNQGDNRMKVKVESIDLEQEVEMTEESIKKFVDVVEEKTADLVTGIDDARPELERLKALSKALGDDATPETVAEMKAAATDGLAYKKSLVEDIVKYMKLHDLLPEGEDKVQAEKDILGILTAEQLAAKLGTLKKKWDEAHPPTGDLPENDDDPAKKPDDDKKKKKVRKTNKTSFQSAD